MREMPLAAPLSTMLAMVAISKRSWLWLRILILPSSHLSSLISHLSSLISHLSSLISHLSSLICHLSSVICHLSSVICHRSSLFDGTAGTERWKTSTQSTSAGSHHFTTLVSPTMSTSLSIWWRRVLIFRPRTLR
jgi:hypothetical protein